jgi:peptidyl-prolyl cis-trans isomerase D
MFEFVRQHNRIMQFLLFLLIFPSFVLFGIEGYNRFREKGEVVATVNGNDINQAEWDNVHRAQVERMRSAMPTADVKLFDTPEARQATLERMVRERVLQAAAGKMRLGVSDQRLAFELSQDSNIASLRKADGSLDMERYRQLLGAQGMTPEMFEGRVRAELASRQVMQGIGQSSFASTAVADVTLNAFYEQRQVRVAKFDSNDFVAQVKPTDDELMAYYKAHQEQFQAPERADVEFVVLNLAAVQKNLVVPESELRSFYEQNMARLASMEERRVSHILIAADKSAPAAERDKARSKAQSLLAEIKAAPDKFADLARKNSQDPVSAAKGGDLDFFARGAMVKPFEDAAFAMKKGDTSDVVETDFGFHILRVTDIRAPKQKTFEESKATLEEDARRQIAQRKFAEAAETFTNMVYEQSDTLAPVAEKLKLEVRRVSGVGRDAQAPVMASPLNNDKLLAAIFSADTLEKQRNTQAIEVGPNQLAAARVTQYTPARTLPYDDVKAKVRERVVAEQAAKLARDQGAAKLSAWKTSPEQAQLANAVVISREQKQQLPATVIEAALRASTSTLPAWVGVDLGTSGYAIVKVEKVLPNESKADRSSERAQYEQWLSSAEGLAYYRYLRNQLKVEVKTPKL